MAPAALQFSTLPRLLAFTDVHELRPSSCAQNESQCSVEVRPSVICCPCERRALFPLARSLCRAFSRASARTHRHRHTERHAHTRSVSLTHALLLAPSRSLFLSLSCTLSLSLFRRRTLQAAQLPAHRRRGDCGHAVCGRWWRRQGQVRRSKPHHDARRPEGQQGPGGPCVPPSCAYVSVCGDKTN
jgi:hypothetical protein